MRLRKAARLHRFAVYSIAIVSAILLLDCESDKDTSIDFCTKTCASQEHTSTPKNILFFINITNAYALVENQIVI